MEVEGHEFEARPFNSALCNECDLGEKHPVHGIKRMLGIKDRPVWVDVPAVKVVCKHESFECNGSGVPVVRHACTDCDWCWTNFDNKAEFAYCDSCKPEQFTKFETKDSGKRESYDSGMVRDTQDDKPRFDLLYPLGIPYSDQFLTRVAGLLARGAVKYEERNWEKAEGEPELNRFQASAMRHLVQWICGETDEDHMAAVVFNLMGAHLVQWKLMNRDDED